MFSKHRIEALSDGIFAIAMTLLILDLKVPTESTPGALAHALRHESHEWVSFAITFALASIFWTLQHRVFDLLGELGNESVAITFVFLGFVSILPFSTALWGHHVGDPVAYMVYFLNQFFLAAVLLLKLERARATAHLRLGTEADVMRLRLVFLCAAMGVAAITSRLVPTRYIAVVMVPIALIGRYLRIRQKKRFAAAANLTLSPTPE